MEFNFIWLDCPESDRSCPYTIFDNDHPGNFRAVHFRRSYNFDRPVSSIKIFVSADTRYFLWAGNGEKEPDSHEYFVGSGPSATGGDYANTKPMPRHFYDTYELTDVGSKLEFFARVYLSPDVMTDYSRGRGGFALTAEVCYADGGRGTLATDESWLCGCDSEWISSTEFDETAEAETVDVVAKTVADIWKPSPSGLRPLKWTFIQAVDSFGAEILEITVAAGEKKAVRCVFPLVYAGYTAFSIDCAGEVSVQLKISELPESPYASETLKFSRKSGIRSWRSIRMFSIGEYTLEIENKSAYPAKLTAIGQYSVNYPTESVEYPENGQFRCSDGNLNALYELGKHTLSICRQTLHLDSPLHQETLGCTGDYFIESRMNYVTFADPALTRLDLTRTADWLEMSGGFMFHTTYSLIWLQMLWDYYMFTADAAIFAETEKAMRCLLSRFESYVGDSGTLETPPSFMFVDWCPLDGYNLHHPPMALGQAVLNAFWYKGLLTAEAIYKVIGDVDSAKKSAERAAELKLAFEIFWDEDRGLYFDGLNKKYTPSTWLPENSCKRYFSTQTNVLAALYGLCDEKRSKAIVRRVLNDDGVIGFQPYFGYFVLEALKKTGQFGEHGKSVLSRWDVLLDFRKGLSEGWGEFHGDHSHAWGGAPSYALPAYLTGFKMLEPGFKRFALNPELYWLDEAEIRLPLPGGSVRVSMKRGEKTIVSLPENYSGRCELSHSENCELRFISAR